MTTDLSWLLDDLVARVPEVGKAVVLTRDGLPVGASATLSREEAEWLCAIAAGFHGLAGGTAHELDGGFLRQVIVEMDAVFLLVTAAGAGCCLAVITSASADVGLVAYEMALLVKRLADQMAVPRRAVPVPAEAT